MQIGAWRRKKFEVGWSSNAVKRIGHTIARAALPARSNTSPLTAPDPIILLLAADLAVVAATIGAKDGPQDSEMTFLALMYVCDIRRDELDA
jgi:hypothetical protein